MKLNICKTLLLPPYLMFLIISTETSPFIISVLVNYGWGIVSRFGIYNNLVSGMVRYFHH